MTSKLVRSLTLATLALSLSAVAQTTTPAPLPTTPGTTASSAPAGTGKIGFVNVEAAIYGCNEGQRDFEALSKKLEPKQAELKGVNDELEALKKQLSAQGDKLNEDARANLVRQIDTKQKAFDRSVQDARDDAQTQNGEIAQKLFQKIAPVLQKYAIDNGYAVVIDTSKQWPEGPVILNNGSMDITRGLVAAYNAQSGVAAPATTASKPATPHATGTTTKPATPK